MSLLLKAIQKLHPKAEVVIYDNDLSTAIWHNFEGNKPTQAEIDSAIEQIKKDELQAEIDKAEAKAAAEAKLVALGLDLDDLRALGL
jgi:siroheme synthase